MRALRPLRTGHSSTSIAAGFGVACGKKEGKTVVVIGDASLGGGVAFEGLNTRRSQGESMRHPQR